VGPGDDEIDRLGDLLRSVRDHSRGENPCIVLVDDAPRARNLRRICPEATVLRTPVWQGRVPDPLTAMTTGTIEAMQRASGDFALKLDTDALVIGRFADAIRAAFAADPILGVVGAYERSPDGGRRDWSMWPTVIRRTTWPLKLPPQRPGQRRHVLLRPRSERVVARRVIQSAVQNPNYQLGAHCLGGAYAVSSRLLAHAPQWDWRTWAQAGLGEDIVIGLLCASAGLRMRGLVECGDPFGVAWKGLPASPAELMDRRYAIVHSLKSGEQGTEEELRAWFRGHAAS
jgi:hypothetical protein